jgi:PAS domain S-box-containing protein
MTYGISYRFASLADQSSAAPLWLPDSVLLCWLLLGPRDEWWFYLIAPLPIRVAAEAPFHVAPLWFLIATSAIDSTKALFSAWVLERVLRRPVRLNSLQALCIFLAVAAVLTPTLSAILGASARFVLGYDFVRSLYEWFLGNALAGLLTTPALLYWFTYTESKPRLKELALLVWTLALVLGYTFLTNHSGYRTLLLYAPVPFLIWAAARLGPLGTSTALAMLAIVSIASSTMGTGIFASDSSPHRLVSLQLFLAVVSIPVLLLAEDIKERKLATQALRESEERFWLVANTAPVAIWMSGPDRLRSYFNQQWLKFTGRSVQKELGNGWAQGVHDEDLKTYLGAYSAAFARREPFQVEYRLRRHDGEYRWIFDCGVPRFNADRSFAGYIGSAIDVTERKLAEEALSSMSRKLIEAHEEERTWIARELHDDINQRVALLAVNPESLKQDPPSSKDQANYRVEEVRRLVQEIGSDIQTLSHRLHPSRLEYLGLEAASAGFCKELSKRQNVEIDFHSESIRRDLSKEISLCLFRVLQEALQNAVKHSGSRHFQVSLRDGTNTIELTVYDSGTGFEPEKAIDGQGLGLTSMKERLKLVDGQLLINSKLQQGTTVHARVPLRPRMKSAGAAR